MIRKQILDQMKSDGFRNSRIKGQHPGHTISVGGILLEFNHTEYMNYQLGDIGYTDSKAKSLIRGYLNKEKYLEWIAALKLQQTHGSIDADIMMFPEGSHGHGRGPCLTAMGFRDTRVEQPTLTVFSRSSEFPHKFLADLWLLTGIAESMNLLSVIEPRPIMVRWFISLLWMDCRTINYLRVMKNPIHPPYSNDEKFEFRTKEQWETYIDSEKEVSFSTLRNLKKLHQGQKKVSTLTPGSLTRLMELT